MPSRSLTRWDSQPSICWVFSMGGFISQLIVHQRPDLVRRLILAGTRAGGRRRASTMAAAWYSTPSSARPPSTGIPSRSCSFRRVHAARQAADDFLGRLNARHDNRDREVSNETAGAQIAAITGWGNDASLGPALHTIRQPVLVANGDNDIVVPTSNSIALFRGLPNAELSIFPDAGHAESFNTTANSFHRRCIFSGEPDRSYRLVWPFRPGRPA